MRSELHRLFTLPRLAVAMLLAGVLLTILAVTALAGEPPPGGATVAAPVRSETAGAPSASPGGPTGVPAGLSPASLDQGSPGETATETVEHANEGAIEPVAEEVVEAARVEVSADGRFSMPLVDWVRVTDRYGAARGAGLVHGGIDLAVGGHVPVLAACDGIVTTATYSGVYGNYVVMDCGDGWATLYGHLSSLTVEPGDRVDRATGLGRSGSTGYSTGEHLHFEIIYKGARVNPEHYLDFKIPPGTPLSSGPIYFPRDPYSGEPGGERPSATEPTPEPTEAPPTATPTATFTPTPTATPTVTNTPTPTPTATPPPPTPTPTPRPVMR